MARPPCCTAQLDQLLDFGLESPGEVGAGERVSDIGGEEADLGAALEGPSFVFHRKERLALEQLKHRVGDLDLAPRALFLRGENLEDLGLQDVAAENREVRGAPSGHGLIHHTLK